MKRNLGSIFSIATAALFLSLASASDAQAQSGWDVYSLLSQAQRPTSFVAPVYSSHVQSVPSQTQIQFDTGQFSQAANVTGLPTSHGQANLTINTVQPAESYGYVQSPPVSFHSATPAASNAISCNT